MSPSQTAVYSSAMAIVDTETVLNRTRLALDATAIGEALLDGDMEEARFRAHLLRVQASGLGLDAVANAALRVITFLPPNERLPASGIGQAMVSLCNTLKLPY